MIRDIPKQYKSPFLTKVAGVIRARHYSYRTEQTYIGWIVRYIRYHRKRHPEKMGPAEVSAFLTHLAVKEHVAASTQNQALNALVFMYRHVLGIEYFLTAEDRRNTQKGIMCNGGKRLFI